jgi:hypothetical protein
VTWPPLRLERIVTVSRALLRSGLAPADMVFLALFHRNLDGITKVRFLSKIRIVLEMPPALLNDMMPAMIAGKDLGRYFSHDEIHFLIQEIKDREIPKKTLPFTAESL